MKRFPHIVSKLFYEPLVITRERHRAICQVVEAHMTRVEASDGPSEEQGKPEYVEVEKTAIIHVNGVLVPKAADIPMSSCGCGLDDVTNMLSVAVSDPNVSRIIFNFNSPGGDVVGVPELGRRIAGIVSKETVAFTDTECCSGALWLATQCQNFYATASSRVGSIGVWTAYLDESKALKKAGVKVNSFSGGKYKLMGAPWRTLTDEEASMIQARVDKIYGEFKEAVNNRRSVADEFMQGQIFDGEEAVSAGLVDGLVESLDEIL